MLPMSVATRFFWQSTVAWYSSGSGCDGISYCTFLTGNCGELAGDDVSGGYGIESLSFDYQMSSTSIESIQCSVESGNTCGETGLYIP